MDRSYASGAAGSAPSAPASPSIGYPTAGNPGTGTPATKPGPYWYHQITEELLAIITAAGITPAQGTLTQLASAIQSGKLFSSAAGGTADAITGIYNPGITALTNGMTLYLRAGSANATTTPTFTPASGTIAAKQIVKGAGAALVAGDIAGPGHWICMSYDQALDKWVLNNPAASGALASQSEVAARTNSAKLVTPLSLQNLEVQGSPVALSGTAVNFPGIPDWAKHVQLDIIDLSFNASATLMAQLGDAGGIETSGYVGCALSIAAGVTTESALNGIGFNLQASEIATAVFSGSILFSRSGTGNDWVQTGILSRTSTAGTNPSAGRKTLSQPLTQITLTSLVGTAAFDGGTAALKYWG